VLIEVSFVKLNVGTSLVIAHSLAGTYLLILSIPLLGLICDLVLNFIIGSGCMPQQYYIWIGLHAATILYLDRVSRSNNIIIGSGCTPQQ